MNIKTEISYVGITLITFLLISANCASLSTLEQQVVSDNDSIRVDAWNKFDNKLTTEQEYKVIIHLITKAKYSKPHESLKAFEFLAHSGRSDILVYGTRIIGCPSPDLIKRINKWDSKLKNSRR